VKAIKRALADRELSASGQTEMVTPTGIPTGRKR